MLRVALPRLFMPRGMNSPRETTPMQAKCIKLDLILDQVVIIQFHVYFHPAVGSHWSSSALLSRMRCVHCLRLLKPADMIVLPGRRSLRQIWLGASRGLLLSGIAVKMSKPTNAAEAPPLHTPRVVQVGCFIFQFLKYWLLLKLCQFSLNKELWLNEFENSDGWLMKIR